MLGGCSVDLLETILKRRRVRAFTPEAVPDKIVDTIVDALKDLIHIDRYVREPV